MSRPATILRLKSAAERDTAAAVRHLVQVHRRVRLAERRNGGGMKNEKTGAFTWFYQILRFGQWKLPDNRTKMAKWPMVALDTEGWLIDGRYFGIEIKKGDWVKPTDHREHQQAERIRFIRSVGGVAGFVTSVEQAQQIVES